VLDELVPSTWHHVERHAFMQNVRRGHYELGVDTPRGLRVAAAFTELATAI
jgi:transposase, IS6 family